nr:unnamed protein product [Callosobruchus analis]
MFVNLLSIL